MAYEGEDDLIYNTSTRCPVCLCLDTSLSMSSCLGELMDGIQAFYDAIKKDEVAASSCEIAIVTFSDCANVVEDFSTIDKKNPVHLTVNGGTCMGAGVKKALEILENRKEEYKKNGIDYFQPWIVIMSDGYPNDENSTKEAQDLTKSLESQKKLTIFPIGIGSADLDVLSGFSNKKRAFKLKDLRFDKFFERLGKSVSILSNSRPDDKIKLDAAGLDDFLEI